MSDEAAGNWGEVELLGRIVRLTKAVRVLEKALLRWSQEGRVGHVWPAGPARSAMVGTGLALERGDMLFGTARDLPVAIAIGVRFETVLKHAFGVEGDPCLGRAMPGAICVADLGVSLSDSGPAAHLVHAAGFGHAARLAGSDRIGLGVFGSGGQANGELHAALNFAAVNRSQVVFVARGPRGGEIPLTEAAEAWGITAVAVEGDDGMAVHGAVRAARERAVAGEGPSIVDARYDGRPQPRDSQALQAAGRWNPEAAERVDGQIAAAFDKARRIAEAAAPIGAATLFDQVYAERPWMLREESA